MPTKDKETQEFTEGKLWVSSLSSDFRYIISSKDGFLFETVSDTPHQANGERLVLCWNSHDELVEALKRMYNRFNNHPDLQSRMTSTVKLDTITLEKARAAIAKATAQTQEDKK